MYILPKIEACQNIYFNMDDLYEEVLQFDFIPEGEHNKKVFPYRKAMGDMYDTIYEASKWIQAIRSSDYVNKPSFDEKWGKREKLREKKRREKEEIREKAYKEGQEMATSKYNWLKLKTIDPKIKKEVKVHTKAYREGLKAGRKIEYLTDEQILRKAESIQNLIKLGFKKKLGDEVKNV